MLVFAMVAPMTEVMAPILSWNFSTWQQAMRQISIAPSLVPAITSSFYQNQSESWQQDQRLSSTSKIALKELMSHIQLPKIGTQQEAQDGTVKFLFELHDGKKVETVFIPFFKRDSVCLSSQVGCAMACSFCHTGLQGLERHLTTDEIVGQYMMVWHWMKTHRPERKLMPNIVFMGQGEPLHNFAAIKTAIDIFTHPHMMGLGPRQLTVSTAGYLPGLKRFAELGQVNLALSLHSPFNEERAELIPINKTWSLEDVFAVIDHLPRRKRQFVVYEYLLIKNKNDSDQHAQALHDLLKHRCAIVNIIPFNPFPNSQWERPDEQATLTFKEKLVQHGLATMVRTTKGNDILAACGQLNSQSKLSLGTEYGNESGH